MQQVHGLEQQLVEALGGDVYRWGSAVGGQGNFGVGGVLSQSGEEVAHPALGGIDAFLETQAAAHRGVTGLGEMLERGGAAPLCRDLPAAEEQ